MSTQIVEVNKQLLNFISAAILQRIPTFLFCALCDFVSLMLIGKTPNLPKTSPTHELTILVFSITKSTFPIQISVYHEKLYIDWNTTHFYPIHLYYSTCGHNFVSLSIINREKNVIQLWLHSYWNTRSIRYQIEAN